MAEAHRKQRWDAGTVQISRRDVRLLTVIGENGGARLSLLRWYLAVAADEAHPRGRGGLRQPLSEDMRSDGATRHWVGRMVRGGYLRKTTILGGAWFTITPAGARLVGLTDDEGHATPRVIESAMMAEHTEVVGRLRLWLAGEYPEAEWVSEREFWLKQQENKKVTFRRPDGALDFPDRRVGIEVELHRKRAGDYLKAVGSPHDSLAEVWWYTPPDLGGWLAEALTQAELRLVEHALVPGKKITPWNVRDLPEGVWP